MDLVSILKSRDANSAIQSMGGDFTSRINASDVADYINLERSFASRIIKKCFGIRIYRYISEVRFKKACELLKNRYSDYGNFLRTLSEKLDENLL